MNPEKWKGEQIYMKIALFGASGTIGQRIAQEALKRGHEVTAIVRDPSRIELSNPQLTVKRGNVLNPDSVTQVVAEHDVVVSAIGPSQNQPAPALSEAAHSLLDGVKLAGVKRLLVVGGAGSLEVAPGVQLVDTPDFPAAWKPVAQAHRDALEVYRQNNDLDWTYFSPAAFIAPGERTGKYRLGTEQLVTNEQGESRISAEDYAVALLDEIEQPRFIRQRFTVAY
jgi:putative NADH-flavin reductase